MTAFEFSMIPVAIMIGFALTRLLNCWANMANSWSAIEKPGLFLIYTVFMMVGALSHFVGDWSFREVELGFGRLMLIILPTLFMILGVSIMVPPSSELPSNLEEHYFQCVQKSLGLMALGIVLSVIPDHFPGVTNAPPIWMVGFVVVPMTLLVLFTHRLVHVVGLTFLGLVMLLQLSGLSGFGQLQ